MFFEKRATEYELPCQRLRIREVAVRLDSHPTQRFPTSLGSVLLNRLKQFRVVVTQIVLQLQLALTEAILRKLFYQPHDGVKGTSGFTARLAQSPVPRQRGRVRRRRR